MPRGDKTGPAGIGPMTGRAAGFCAGFGMPGYATPAFGRGFGLGRGRGARGCGFGNGGRGWRIGYHATGAPGWQRFAGNAAPFVDFDPAREKQSLKNQADAMQNELDVIRRRLEELEKEENSK